MEPSVSERQLSSEEDAHDRRVSERNWSTAPGCDCHFLGSSGRSAAKRLVTGLLQSRRSGFCPAGVAERWIWQCQRDCTVWPGTQLADSQAISRRRKWADPFRCLHSLLEVIRLVVLLYVRFPLSLRDIDDLLFEREASTSATRPWNRIGPMFAAVIRRQRVTRWRRHWKWHLDEVYPTINAETHRTIGPAVKPARRCPSTSFPMVSKVPDPDDDLPSRVRQPVWVAC